MTLTVRRDFSVKCFIQNDHAKSELKKGLNSRTDNWNCTSVSCLKGTVCSRLQFHFGFTLRDRKHSTHGFFWSRIRLFCNTDRNEVQTISDRRNVKKRYTWRREKLKRYLHSVFDIVERVCRKRMIIVWNKYMYTVFLYMYTDKKCIFI